MKSDKKKRVVRIFQSASAMHGKRNAGSSWMSNVFRSHNQILRDIFIKELGFLDFDEWMATVGMPEHTDGWHYGLSQIKMNSMIVI